MKLFLLIFCLLSLPVRADIYKYLDESGNVTYTNRPVEGAQRLILEPAGPAASTGRDAATTAKAAPSARPANFPRIDGDLQKKRDATRRKLLEAELAAERAQLAEAKTLRAQAQRSKKADDVRRHETAAVLHEKNIEALNKEIARIK